MRIIAMANGGFSIPTLQAIKESSHELIALFAMPLRTKKSGGKTGIPPIRDAISGFLSDVPLYEPDNVNDADSIELLRSLNADIIFICDYGRILSNDVLSTTKHGGINLHGSLLPKYRGAAPINRAIQAGERELGVSVIFIEPSVDAGPIVACDSYIPSVNETAIEIEEHLAKIGAPLVIDALMRIEKNEIISLPQNVKEVSKAPKVRKEEGKIDWNQTSNVIINQFRAFQPWPRVFSDWYHEGSGDCSPIRIILGPFVVPDYKAKLSEDELNSYSVGSVVYLSNTEIWIKTGDGVLSVLELQQAGKKQMTPESFLRGRQMSVGDVMC